ncbi:MAG: alpha amylase C-terminal domain-containing protein [Gemmatimonadota bacterium]|nr:MAG: alpha amylase C-terminal domain-containing protein [Gemmatimonadota bacterium]
MGLELVRNMWKFFIVLNLFLSAFCGCGERGDDGSTTAGTAENRTVIFQLDVDQGVVDSVQLVGEVTGPGNKPIGMKRDSTGQFWTTTLSLSPGQSYYKYKFMIHRSDQNVWLSLTDPKAQLIDASQNRNSVVIMKRQKKNFTPFKPPSIPDLIIYELNPREFVDPQVPFAEVSTDPNAQTLGIVFRDITRTIERGYFTELGVNAIELMPIFSSAWTSYDRDGFERDPWGYNCITWYGLNGDFGTPEDLRQLVEAAHREGIAVLLDFSMGHGSGQIIGEIHTDWLKRADNPWGMIEFDMSHEGARTYMLDAAQLWIQEYNIDGFRMDWIDQYKDEAVEWYPGGTWAWFTEQLRSVKPDIILIAENPTPEIVRNTDFDSCWDFFFAEWCGAILLREAYSYFDGFVGSTVNSQDKLEENLTGYVYAPWGPHKPMVRFLESHDTPRIARGTVLAQHGGGPQGWLDINGDDILPDTLSNGSLARSRLGGVLLFTLPGPIMLFQGQEFGADDDLAWEYDPVDWDLKEANDSLFQFYTRLASLRKDYESLRSEDLTVLKNDSEHHIFVYSRGVVKNDAADDDVLVALNFGDDREGNENVSLPFPKPGMWIEYLKRDTLEISSASEEDVDFEYSEGKIFLFRTSL